MVVQKSLHLTSIVYPCMVVNEMNPHTTKFMLFCFYILILSLNYRYFNFNLNSVKHLEFSSLMLLTCFNEKTRFLGTLETLKYQTTFPLVLRVEFSNRQLIIPYQPRHIISTEIIYLFDMIRSIKYQIKAYHIQCVLSFYTNNKDILQNFRSFKRNFYF